MAIILFYSPVRDIELFERVGFYSTDINILRDLGHEVVVANRLEQVMKARYDILFAYFYTWSAFAAAIARSRGRRVLMTGGADELDECYNKSAMRLRIHRSLFRIAYFFASKVLAVSTTDLRNFADLVGRDKIVLAPHVVDTDVFKPGQTRVLNTLLTIGWMGTEGNVKRKGMDATVRILAALRAMGVPAKLVIVGTEGAGTLALRRLVADLGVTDAVEFRFSISEVEKIHLLQTSGYYFQLSEFEGFGLAALEALACGSCVVHTARGGLADFMESYGLQQAWPVNTDAVAGAIRDIALQSDDGSDQSSQRHAHVVQNFSLSKRRDAFLAAIPFLRN